MGTLCSEQQFREASTKGPTEFPILNNVELAKMNEIERFEHTFPFYRMRIDKYEGHVKRFIYKEDDACISMKQL